MAKIMVVVVMVVVMVVVVEVVVVVVLLVLLVVTGVLLHFIADSVWLAGLHGKHKTNESK